MFAFSALGIVGETLYFFSFGLLAGGPVVLVWSWTAHIVFSLCVSSYMGEMCSIYPCVGSVYPWSAAFAPSPEWGRPISFVCGIFYLVGCLTYDASVAMGVG